MYKQRVIHPTSHKKGNNKMAKKFLTVSAFAEEIGIHPDTVREWDNKGILKAHHKSQSGRRFYTQEQVDKYKAKYFSDGNDILSDVK